MGNNNNDRSEGRNRAQDLPQFDLSKKGRIQMDIYRMDTGYLIIDQDTTKKSALRDDKDIGEIMTNVAANLETELKKSLLDKGPNEFVSLTIILENQQVDYNPEPDFDEPATLEMTQLAELMNEMVNGNIGGIPGIRMGKFTARSIQDALASKRFIQIKHRIKTPYGEQAPSNNIPKTDKPYYHDNSGNKQNNKGENKGGGPTNQTTKID